MELSEKELVQKMKHRLSKERARQQRWRNRQKEKGLKSIAGMVSPETFEILQQEKNRTGEKVSDVLERAIRGLLQGPPPTPEPVPAATEAEIPESQKPSTKKVLFEAKKDIIDRIERMRAGDGLPFNEIAKRLNAEGIATFNGKDHWEGRQVYDIYKTVETVAKAKYHQPE